MKKMEVKRNTLQNKTGRNNRQNSDYKTLDKNFRGDDFSLVLLPLTGIAESSAVQFSTVQSLQILLKS